MAELNFRLTLITDDASTKLTQVQQEADSTRTQVENPIAIKISAEQALATIRDVKIAVDGVVQVVGGLVRSMNSLLDAALVQRQAVTLTNIAFEEASVEMQNFASAMQNVTNFGDEQLLPLMAKLAQTFKLNKDEVQALVPVLLDFAEANKATGMTVESAFDLMGRALNGHTAMLGRYGIELDDSRLKMEGVAYLVEKLGEDYGGTAEALVDLRTQNSNAWGDIKETIGEMLNALINPLLKGLKWLMDAYNSLSPVMKGFVAGLLIAIPVIGTVTTAITALSAAYHALQVAMNPVAGIIGITVGALSALGLGLAAASMKTDALAESQKSMADDIRECSRQVSVESEKFSLLAIRLLELRSATSLAAADKIELKNIVRKINDQYGEYLGNINLETVGYDLLEKAINGANEALMSKMTTQAYETMLSRQVQKLAEAKVALSKEMSELLDVSVPSTQDNFLKVAFEQLKMLENRFSDWKTNPTYTALRSMYDQVKIEADALKNATNEYNSAVMGLKKLGAPASTGSVPVDSGKEERRLEQLRQLQQKYDTLGIDDALLRKQKELEIQRDAELARAESLGASEELLQSIRDRCAVESIQAETDAAEARTKQIELETEAKRRVLEEEKRHQQELEDTRFEFSQRGLELMDRTGEAELQAVDQYYAKRHDALIAAGLTEEQITEQTELAKAKIKDSHERRSLQGARQVLGDLAKTSEAFGKKGFVLWKALSIGQATIDTYASATGAYKAMVGIPVVGPGLAVAAAAAAIAAGMANVAAIANTPPPKAATGGLLVGRSHGEGGILIEAEGDEYITAKDRVKALGKNLFDFLNFAPIEQVKLAFAGMPVPSVPIPSNAGLSYGSGGPVGGGAMNLLLEIMSSMRDEIVSLQQTVRDSKSVIDVHVDPLSNDPVRVSEIADTGKLIRSEV